MKYRKENGLTEVRRDVKRVLRELAVIRAEVHEMRSSRVDSLISDMKKTASEMLRISDGV